MRIAIVGVGGVGGYFGGKLAREYAIYGKHEIIFIARGEHLKAIQQNGLQLFTREGDYVAWPNIATDNPAITGLFDLVFFCVKSYSLESSARSVEGNIHHNTVVIPLQNGVNSTQRLRVLLPAADVISGSVYIISHLEKPGVVRQSDGACRLTFGTDDEASAKKYSAIHDLLVQANIDARLTGKISEALWSKYLLMCPLGSLTAATGKTYGAVMADPDLRSRLNEMMKEVVAVAKARGILLPDDAVEKTMDQVGRFAFDAKTSMQVGRFAFDAKTSMQLDREKGRPTEIDTLTAYLIEAGREAGIPTPAHAEAYRQIVQ